jgi:hypothetical protein
MKNHLRGLATRGLNQIHTHLVDLQNAVKRLWRAHLDRLASSPVYETVLLALIDLALGHRVDLHALIIRMMTRLRRSPELPETDGWAY